VRKDADNKGPRSEADGAPIPNYFPAVVTEDEFNKARAALSRRTDFRGPIGEKVPKLFAGLLIDASTRSRIWIKKNSRGQHMLASADAVESRVYGSSSFPYLPFEKSVLSLLKEISPADVLGGEESEAESVSLAIELAELDDRLTKIELELAEGDIPVLARTARTLEAKRLTLAARLKDAREKEASPLDTAWTEAQSLLDATKKEADRMRLRDLLRQLVEEVYVLVVPHGQSHRLAAVQIFFTGGSRRDYLIYHRVACNHRKDGTWKRTTSFAPGDKKKGHEADLRVPEDVKDLQAALGSIDLKAIFPEADQDAEK
jgi:hypothetical protein